MIAQQHVGRWGSTKVVLFVFLTFVCWSPLSTMEPLSALLHPPKVLGPFHSPHKWYWNGIPVEIMLVASFVLAIGLLRVFMQWILYMVARVVINIFFLLMHSCSHWLVGQRLRETLIRHAKATSASSSSLATSGHIVLLNAKLLIDLTFYI